MHPETSKRRRLERSPTSDGRHASGLPASESQERLVRLLMLKGNEVREQRAKSRVRSLVSEVSKGGT